MSVEKMYASDIEVKRTLPKWTLRIKAEKVSGRRNAALGPRHGGCELS